jgi:hypothetical protein
MRSDKSDVLRCPPVSTCDGSSLGGARDAVGASFEVAVGSWDFVGDFVGTFVGAFVGDFVGTFVGAFVGDFVGTFVGAFVGDFVKGLVLGIGRRCASVLNCLWAR